MAAYDLRPPTYRSLMLPVMRAVVRLGGSASTRQLYDETRATIDPEGRWDGIAYASGELKIINRIAWAMNYCKRGGLLDSPRRALYLITDEGARVAGLSDAEASGPLEEAYRVSQRTFAPKKDAAGSERDAEEPDDGAPVDGEDWQGPLLAELYALSPVAFERYVLHLLRVYGMELKHVGGPGDGGLDGIGTAPVGDLLSVTVAVQAKRYDPAKSVGRDVVALFQRDAQARGAERAVLVTLGTFTSGADEASQAVIPTVELIDGARLCDLIAAKGEQAGVQVTYRATPGFLDRFETPDR